MVCQFCWENRLFIAESMARGGADSPAPAGVGSIEGICEGRPLVSRGLLGEA